MTNKIVQLIDNENNNIYPVAGALMQGAVTTSTISDGAVTQSKIAYSSFSPNSVVTRFYFNTLRTEQKGTFQAQTLKGTTLTFGWSAYGAIIGVLGGAENIKYARIVSSARFSEGVDDDYGIWGISSTSDIWTYGYIGGNTGQNITPPGQQQATTDTIDGITIGFGPLYRTTTSPGVRDSSTISAEFIREVGQPATHGYLHGFAQSRGAGASAQFSTEITVPQGFIPTLYQRGLGGKVSSFYSILEVYE